MTTKTSTQKQPYTRPTLAAYGRLEHLTLGASGSLPDYLGGQQINATCETQTFLDRGTVITRTSCGNVVGS